MGPGLAPVDATLFGDVSQVHLLHHHFGNQTLATAVVTVAQRAMTLRDEFDEELVMELTHAHLATWGDYDEFIIGKRDRLRMASEAIRSARNQALRELRHSMRAALAWEDDMKPPAYTPNRLSSAPAKHPSYCSAAFRGPPTISSSSLQGRHGL